MFPSLSKEKDTLKQPFVQTPLLKPMSNIRSPHGYMKLSTYLLLSLIKVHQAGFQRYLLRNMVLPSTKGLLVAGDHHIYHLTVSVEINS